MKIKKTIAMGTAIVMIAVSFTACGKNKSISDEITTSETTLSEYEPTSDFSETTTALIEESTTETTTTVKATNLVTTTRKNADNKKPSNTKPQSNNGYQTVTVYNYGVKIDEEHPVYIDGIKYYPYEDHDGHGGGLIAEDEMQYCKKTVTFPASREERDKQAMVVAKKIADEVGTEGTDLERVNRAAQRVHGYCEKCFYDGNYNTVIYREAYGVFIGGVHTCAGATRAMGMVLDCMGFEWEHMNPNQMNHQWCRLTMDGKIGYADGQAGYAGYGENKFQ